MFMQTHLNRKRKIKLPLHIVRVINVQQVSYIST